MKLPPVQVDFMKWHDAHDEAEDGPPVAYEVWHGATERAAKICEEMAEEAKRECYDPYVALWLRQVATRILGEVSQEEDI